MIENCYNDIIWLNFCFDKKNKSLDDSLIYTNNMNGLFSCIERLLGAIEKEVTDRSWNNFGAIQLAS